MGMFPGIFVQDEECFICAGRTLHLFYPGINEWFDIYDKVDEAGIEKPLMALDRISVYSFIKKTGWPGLLRISRAFFGTRCFSPLPKIEKEEDKQEYENTEDFFAGGPRSYRDMMPPIIIGDNITESDDG